MSTISYTKFKAVLKHLTAVKVSFSGIAQTCDNSRLIAPYF
jgi:hypothetical protein